MSSISAKAGAIVDFVTLLARWPASLGQKTMANSLPVVLASDQGGVPASGGGIYAAATAADAGSGTDDEAITGAASGLRLLGFSAHETTGTAGASFILHNGTGNGDPATFAVSLAANESRSEWFGPDGIASASGIWLERVTGNIRVVVFHKAVA